jgi:uncharacterized protein (TIGR03437 family)
LTLGGGANPAGLQWNMTNPNGAAVYETSNEGAVADNAGKSITCTTNSGTTTCVIFGINTNTMANGVAATIGFRIQPGTTATSATIQLSGFSATSAAGTSLTLTGSGNTITINQPTPVNTAPVASGASVSTNEDTALPISLTATDIDGNPLTYTIVTAPTKGTVSAGTGSGRTYTPNTNATGADSFTFRANDGAANSNTATVNITINPVNDAPVAQNQAVSTAENTAKAITLAGTDVEGSTLTYSIVTGPANGNLTGSGANRTYTPNAGFSGSNSFTFRVNDGTVNSNTATVSITVTDTPNNAPTATGAAVSTNEDTALPIALTAADQDGDPLTYAIVTPPTKGTVSGGTGSARTYTPNADASGSDSFTFRANDGAANSNTATVNITINPVNDAPVAQNQAVSTPQNTAKQFTMAGSDVEGSPLTYMTTGGPSHGSMTGTGATRTYTPTSGYTGPDSVTFKVNDGSLDSNVATVSITVTQAANNAPSASGGSVSTNEDTPKAIPLTATDQDGNTLTYVITDPPDKGTLSGSGANRNYTPNANANGPDSFTFKVNDGTVDSNIATVNITINSLNDPPTAQNLSASAQKNKALALKLVGNDVDGDPLTYAVLTQPQQGGLVGTPPSLTYTSTNGYTGVDSFKFRVADPAGMMAEGTVSINVVPGNPNKPPKAHNQSVTTQQNKSRSITLQGSDEDGDALTFSVTSGPSNGGLSGTPPNLTYTPNSNFQGSDSFAFLVDDKKGGTATGTVSIDVLEVAPLGLESLTCNGNTLTGGGYRTCHVFLTGPAPTGGVNVGLKCATKQLSVPAFARVPGKANSVSFKVSSGLIQTAETVELAASMGNAAAASPGPAAVGNGSATVSMKLVPLQPTALSCSPLQVKAGKTLTCEANLNSSGFSERSSLSIQSSTPAVKLPDSVPLRPGRSSVSFRGSIDESSPQQSATITVGLFGGQASSTVSIVTAQSPIIRVDSPQVISVGKKLSFEVTARDPNDLPVTLSAMNLPAGANFNAQNGRFDWTPGEPQAGTHPVTFRATNSANAFSQKIVTIEVIVGTLKIFAFTNAASSSGDVPCSPGSLATLWGTGFTDGSSERARSFPLPTKLNEIKVEMNSRSARLLFVGPRQVNLQCPSLPAGTKLAIRVERQDTGETAEWSAPSVSMKEAAPAIFSLDGSGTGQGLVIIANTPKIAMLPNPDMDAQAAEPAEPGDNLIIYANGLGLVDHEVPDGEPAASSPLSQVVATVRVKVGDVFTPVTFAGLAPSMAGVYQVNTVLSDLVPSGPEVPVTLEIQLPDGTVLQSNTVTIAIQSGTPRFAE